MADKHDGLDAFRRPFDRYGLVVNGRDLDVNIAEAITTAKVTLTMLGCSALALSIADPAYSLTRLGVLGQQPFRATVEYQALSWTTAQLDKTDDGFDMTCVPTGAARLKRKDGPWTQGPHLTRADSAEALCELVGVQFAHNPWTHTKQPVEAFTKEEQQTLADAQASDQAQAITRKRIARGSLSGKGITIKGAKASREQLRNLEAALSVADQFGAAQVPRVAMVCAGTEEGGWLTTSKNPASSARGPFQILDSTAATLGISQTDVTQGATAFLAGVKVGGRRISFNGGPGAIELFRLTPSLGPGEIANAIEGGGAGADFYTKHISEALKIVRAWPQTGGQVDDSGGDLTLTGTPDRVRVEKVQMRVEKHQSYFEAIYGWAAAVNWRFFMNVAPSFPQGQVWFANDLDLAAANPSLVIAEGAGGVNKIRWSRTARGRIDEVNVECNLEQWTGLPGQVVVVEGEGAPADGRYLIHEIERDLLDTEGAATVTLGKPQAPKPEPKPGIVTIPGTSPTVEGDTPTGKVAQVAAAYAKAIEIAKHGYPYVYGGGHGSFDPPYDCSGFVSAVLHAGGLGVDSPMDTVLLGQWGKPGKGKLLTVYVRPTSGMTGHTWLVFEAAFTKGPPEIFEAGGTRGAPTGRRDTHSTDTFEPRHWNGT